MNLWCVDREAVSKFRFHGGIFLYDAVREPPQYRMPAACRMLVNHAECGMNRIIRGITYRDRCGSHAAQACSPAPYACFTVVDDTIELS
jgi:hypothetical protein